MNDRMNRESKIYYSRAGSAKAFLEKALEIFEKRLRGKVLIKPNLVSDEPYPTTTDPELFQELLHLLKGRFELGSGDGSAADLLQPGKALKNHLLYKLAQGEGIKFYDFYQEEMLTGRTGLGDKWEFSAIAGKFDTIISLPVLKTHINVFLTGALKNQFGFLARRDRAKAHFQGRGLLERAIVGINQLCPAHIFIVDFRETLLNSNEVRHGGKTAKAGWLFAGEDPVALDYFGFSLLKEIEPKLFGKSPEEIKYLSLAKNSGLGNDKFELIEL